MNKIVKVLIFILFLFFPFSFVHAEDTIENSDNKQNAVKEETVVTNESNTQTDKKEENTESNTQTDTKKDNNENKEVVEDKKENTESDSEKIDDNELKENEKNKDFAFVNGSNIPFYEKANETKMVNTWFIFDMADKVNIINKTSIKSTIPECKTSFYNASYVFGGVTYTGYVCEDFLVFDLDLSKYKEEFQKNNIPEIYWEGLTILKNSYPNWKFVGINTNLDWDKVITAESQVGKNLIQITSNPLSDSDKALLSLDGGSYDPETNTYLYNKNEGSTWYYPNKDTVAYYMDPRNFFNERSIFMFESLRYNNYATGKESDSEEEKSYSLMSIESMLENTGLFEYSEKFEMAGQVNDVNSVALAARSKQEVVLGNGTLSGSIDKENNLYNFFNIYAYVGAYAGCDSPVACGLIHASKQDWTTPEKAILGGASFIADGYINKGQDTVYFQKWDVIDGGNGLYSHQYMANINAPVSEASKTYNSYYEQKLLDRTFTFYIPVYLNMPLKTAFKPTEVDKEELDKIQESLKPEENVLTIGELIVGAGFKNNSGYVSGLNMGMTVKDFKNKISSISSNATVKVTYNGVEIADTNKIGTGYVASITNEKNKEDVILVLYGDVSGDGIVTVLDLLKVQKHILGSIKLSEAEKLSADVNKDGKVTVLDLLMIQKNILGNLEIKQ